MYFFSPHIWTWHDPCCGSPQHFSYPEMENIIAYGYILARWYDQDIGLEWKWSVMFNASVWSGWCSLICAGPQMTVWRTCSQISLSLSGLCVSWRASPVPFPGDAAVVITAKPPFVQSHSWKDSSIGLHTCTWVWSILWLAAALNL